MKVKVWIASNDATGENVICLITGAPNYFYVKDFEETISLAEHQEFAFDFLRITQELPPVWEGEAETAQEAIREVIDTLLKRIDVDRRLN